MQSRSWFDHCKIKICILCKEAHVCGSLFSFLNFGPEAYLSRLKWSFHGATYLFSRAGQKHNEYQPPVPMRPKCARHFLGVSSALHHAVLRQEHPFHSTGEGMEPCTGHSLVVTCREQHISYPPIPKFIKWFAKRQGLSFPFLDDSSQIMLLNTLKRDVKNRWLKTHKLINSNSVPPAQATSCSTEKWAALWAKGNGHMHSPFTQRLKYQLDGRTHSPVLRKWFYSQDGPELQMATFLIRGHFPGI